MEQQVKYENLFRSPAFRRSLKRGLAVFITGLLAGYPAGVVLLSSITEVFHG